MNRRKWIESFVAFAIGVLVQAGCPKRHSLNRAPRGGVVVNVRR